MASSTMLTHNLTPCFDEFISASIFERNCTHCEIHKQKHDGASGYYFVDPHYRSLTQHRATFAVFIHTDGSER